MKSRSFFLGSTIFCGLTALASTSPALAQGASSGAKPSSIDTSPDIIVTARRVEERLQDVPISMTVFNQQQLNNRNVVTPTDLATYTPSLSADNTYGSQSTTFSLRGFVQTNGTQPSVGVYFADVVAPRGASNNLPAGDSASPGDFFDLQNVQVLKGPQGTLFGRNTTGGAVLLVPQKPTGNLEGYVEGSLGNYDMKRLQAVINVPLSDSARLRVGFDHLDRDGYSPNISPVGPSNFGDLHYFSLRASLVADLAPNLESYTIVTYSQAHDHGPAQGLTACVPTEFLGAMGCAALARNGTGFYNVQNTIANPFQRTTSWRIINTTTFRASDTLTIKNIASYAQLRQVNNAMLFGVALNTGDLAAVLPPAARPFLQSLTMPFATDTSVPGGASADQSTFTDEIQLQGSALGNKLQWQGGLYFEASRPLSTPGSLSEVFLHCDNRAALQCTDATAPLLGANAIGTVNYTVARTNFQNIGAYFQATYPITDTLKLTGGFRYTWDHSTSDTQVVRYTFPLPNTPVRSCGIPSLAISDCRTTYRQTDSAPTWLIDVDYNPTENILIYLKYARGYRTGGITPQAPPVAATFSPEKVNTYEAGIKTTLHGAIRGTINVAGFYNDFSNQQILLQLVQTSGVGFATGIFNAGKSRIYGAEVDASLDLFRGFNLNGGYAYLNSKIQQESLPTLDPARDGYSLEAGTSLVGLPTAFAPRHKLSVTGTYTLPLDDSIGKVSLGATFTYVSSQLANLGDINSSDPAIQQLSFLKARSLVNLNMNWNAIGGLPIDLSAFVTNLTKRKYYTATAGLAGAGTGFDTATFGEPRMVGVRLRYHFGR